MVTVFKKEVNFDDYEWISDASGEELVNYDVAEETVNTSSKDPSSSAPSSSSPTPDSALTPSPTANWSPTISPIKPEYCRASTPKFTATRSPTISPIKPQLCRASTPKFEVEHNHVLNDNEQSDTAESWKSECVSIASYGMPCASALQRTVEGPLKKRILIREGYRKSSYGGVSGLCATCSGSASNADEEDMTSSESKVKVKIEAKFKVKETHLRVDTFGHTWKRVVLPVAPSDDTTDEVSLETISYDYFMEGEPRAKKPNHGRIQFLDYIFPFVQRKRLVDPC